MDLYYKAYFGTFLEWPEYIHTGPVATFQGSVQCISLVFGCKKVVLTQPSSAVIFTTNNSFDSKQQNSSEDYMEASLMLQYTSLLKHVLFEAFIIIKRIIGWHSMIVKIKAYDNCGRKQTVFHSKWANLIAWL